MRPMWRISQIASLRAALLLAALVIGTTTQVVATTPTLLSADLTPYTEVHRLVLVFPGHDGREEAFLDQWDLPSTHARMEHRSLLVFQVKDWRLIKTLRKRMAPGESGFRVWLIDREGHLVLSTSRVMEPWEIFARIDALPERQLEIQRLNDWDAGHESSP